MAHNCIVLSVFAVQTTKYDLGTYSHLSNNRGGWNKRGGGAKVSKAIYVEGSRGKTHLILFRCICEFHNRKWDTE